LTPALQQRPVIPETGWGAERRRTRTKRSVSWGTAKQKNKQMGRRLGSAEQGGWDASKVPTFDRRGRAAYSTEVSEEGRNLNSDVKLR